ncbi:MAG: ribonuclease P protein component [Phaeovulum sp.]|uniref:ribonuclease P protein component n=1 Tax=Phaeovulum sp. TaxID=2934796 RepID=UPI0027321D14|nr:ribonuclease P protein component [Phaeovulum sp.]MDP2063110.1 ribonuclease P protein component [Phaeovulum sp.]MDP3860656.1 ribonuclease P protein component [Phaeovulum sp.]
MAPPEAPANRPIGREPGSAPAVSVCATGRLAFETLRKRPDFLRAASARRQSTPGFLLQARKRAETEAAQAQAVRVGFTCSKKVGNAVARNRAKRRLRALAREVLPLGARPGWDYVLVGRAGATAERDFAAMVADLTRVLAQLHGDAK